MATNEFAGNGAEKQADGWDDILSSRVTAKAEEIRRSHGCCAKLTPPCKVDCPCWFEAADAEADRAMHMRDEEIRAEVIAGGEDPDEVADRVRRIIASAIAQHVRPTTATQEAGQ